jgi:hypothetical protein
MMSTVRTATPLIFLARLSHVCLNVFLKQDTISLIFHLSTNVKEAGSAGHFQENSRNSPSQPPHTKEWFVEEQSTIDAYRFDDDDDHHLLLLPTITTTTDEEYNRHIINCKQCCRVCGCRRRTT